MALTFEDVPRAQDGNSTGSAGQTGGSAGPLTFEDVPRGQDASGGAPQPAAQPQDTPNNVIPGANIRVGPDGQMTPLPTPGQQPAAQGGQPAAQGGQPAAQGGQPAAQGGQPGIFAHGQPLQETASWLNRGAAQGLATLLPVDLVNSALGLVGKVPGVPDLSTQQPFLGSQWIQSHLMQGVSPPAGAQPDSYTKLFARDLGATVTGGMGGVGAASLLPGKGAASSALRQGAQQALRHPVVSGAADVAAAGTAAAGGRGGKKLAQRYNLDPQAGQALGEMIGGLGVAAVPAAGSVSWKLARKTPLVSSLTERSPTVRARDRVQSLAGGPEAAKAAAGKIGRQDVLPSTAPRNDFGGFKPGQTLSPASRTEVPHLLSLEKAVASENPSIARRLEANARSLQDSARQAVNDLGGSTSASDFKQFAQAQRDRLTNALSLRAKKAARIAQRRIDALSPSQSSPEENSHIVRQELEKALNDARTQETQLWNQVPQDLKVSTSNTRQAYRHILEHQARNADQTDIPPVLKETLGQMQQPGGQGGRLVDANGNPLPTAGAGTGGMQLSGGTLHSQDSVRELQTVRSRILDAMRQERSQAAPNRRALDNMDTVQAAVLKDLGAARGDVQGQAGSAIRTALDFSHKLNDKFTRGAVGQVLGYERRGGHQVPPGETLDRTIGKTGTAGGTAADQLLHAADSAGPEGRQAMQQYLQEGFRRQAVDEATGQVNPNHARQFLKRNRAVLDRFPQLRDQIRGAVQAQGTAEAEGRKAQRVTKVLSDGNRSRTALFLNAPVDKEMEKVLRSQDPGRSMQALVNMTKRDSSGRALAGLKSSFGDYLLTKSTKQDGTLSADKMHNLLTDSRTQRAVNRLFTPDEQKRLQQVVQTLSLDAERNAPGLPSIGQTVPREGAPRLIDTVAGILGAHAGRQLNTGTIQVPGKLSGYFQRTMDRVFNLSEDQARQLVADSVEDPELLRALLLPASTQKRADWAARRINAWMAAPAASAAGAVQKDQPQSPSAQSTP